MKRTILALALILMAGTAYADTFVWQDPAGDYTMSFPDTWRIQTSDSGNTSLRIAGPLAEDMATCKMEVSKDGRIKIYPKKLVDEAVAEKLDQNFWQQEAGEFMNAKIANFYAPASLGDRGDATAVHVSYVQDDGKGNLMQMYGMMIGSLYADNLYVISCSSKRDVFTRYQKLFGSIFDSVSLKSKYHPFATGYYRNFLQEVYFPTPVAKPGTRDPYETPLKAFRFN